MAQMMGVRRGGVGSVTSAQQSGTPLTAPNDSRGSSSGKDADPIPRKDPRALTQLVQYAAEARAPYESLWQVCWDWYRGRTADYAWATVRRQSQDGNTEFRSVQVNRVKEVVDTILAQTATRDPEFSLYARHARAVPMEEAASAVVNYFWRNKEMGFALRDALLSNIVIGHGWMKVAWFARLEQQKRAPEELRAAVDAQLIERDAAQVVDPSAQFPTDADIEASVKAEFDAQPPLLISHEEYPLAYAPSPFDMFVDPHANRVDQAAWMAERVYVRYDQLVSNQEYSKKARAEVRKGLGWVQDKTLESAFSVQSSGNRGESGKARNASRASEGPPSEVLVETVEFHNVIDGTWCVFVPNASTFLLSPNRKDPWSPYKGTPYKVPYEMIRNHETPDFFPQGDVEQIIPLNWEENETRTLEYNSRRSQVGKVLMDKQDITPEAKLALESPHPGEIVPLESRNRGAVSSLVTPLVNPPIAYQLFDLESRSYRDLKSTAGINDLQAGVSAPGIRSAAEANAISQSGSARMAEHLERTHHAARRLGARILILAQKWLTLEVLVRITGDDGAAKALVINRDEIQGQYDFEIEFGSMQPRSEMTKQQNVMQFAQLLAGLAPLQGSFVNVPEIAKQAARAFGFVDVDSLVMSQQDRELEMQRQQAFGGEGGPPTQGSPPAMGPSGP